MKYNTQHTRFSPNVTGNFMQKQENTKKIKLIIKLQKIQKNPDQMRKCKQSKTKTKAGTQTFALRVKIFCGFTCTRSHKLRLRLKFELNES